MYKSLLQLLFPLLLSISLAPTAPAQTDFSGNSVTAFSLEKCSELKAKVEAAVQDVEEVADDAFKALDVVYETKAKDAVLQAELATVKVDVVNAYNATQAMEKDTPERAKSQAKVDELYNKQVSLTADIEVNADRYKEAIEDIDDACEWVKDRAAEAAQLLAQYLNQCDIPMADFLDYVKRITDAVADTEWAQKQAKAA